MTVFLSSAERQVNFSKGLFSGNGLAGWFHFHGITDRVENAWSVAAATPSLERRDHALGSQCLPDSLRRPAQWSRVMPLAVWFLWRRVGWFGRVPKSRSLEASPRRFKRSNNQRAPAGPIRGERIDCSVTIKDSRLLAVPLIRPQAACHGSMHCISRVRMFRGTRNRTRLCHECCMAYRRRSHVRQRRMIPVRPL